MSEELTLGQKLSKIQAEINAPKSQKNTFGRYNYRSLEDITSALKGFVAELGVYFVLTDEIVPIGDRFYVKATAEICDGKDKISNTGFAREEENKKGMDGAQITGSSSSYARKYAMNGLLLIDDNKDPDDNRGKKEQPSGTVTPDQKRSIWTIANTIWKDRSKEEVQNLLMELCRAMKIPESTRAQSKEQSSKLIKELDSMLKGE